MTSQMVSELSLPFRADKIRWRVGPTTREKDKGIPLAYIDARDAMERLDAVVGPENWQRRYPWASEKKLCCEVGIRIDGEWVWKSDGAGDTGMESDKGAFSDAFKRACVNWGIARYLYDLPNVWMPIEQKGGSYGFSQETKKELERRIDKWQQSYFKGRAPEPQAGASPDTPSGDDSEREGSEGPEFTPEEADTLIEFIMTLDTKNAAQAYGHWHALEERIRPKVWAHMNRSQRDKLTDILKTEVPKGVSQ